MSNACQQCFKTYDGLERQVRVFQDHGGFQCEEHTCSAQSPGPVKDDEHLIFLLINPTHFDVETGVLHPIAFQEVHKRDLSVFRYPKASVPEIENTIAELIARGMKNIPPKIRRVEQCCTVPASLVRALRLSENRAFGVFDTALDDKPAHASVFTRPDIISSRMKRAQARKLLHSVFSPSIQDVSEVLTDQNLKAPLSKSGE